MNIIKCLFFALLLIGCKNELKKDSQISDPINTKQETNKALSSKNLELLQGSWQNTLDTLSIIKIKGNVITNYYSGLSAGPGAKIELSDRCIDNPDPSRKSEADRYISIKGNYPDCYYITKLDADNLLLNFLNGGFDLAFKKI